MPPSIYLCRHLGLVLAGPRHEQHRAHPVARQQLCVLLDGVVEYGLGASGGGFESLILHFDPREIRTATKWVHSGPCFRVHAGLEHVDDLIADMGRGFAALRALR